LGDGLRLFGGSPIEKRWDLKNVVAYKNGFVELSYGAPVPAGDKTGDGRTIPETTES
jgi:hypothetical protein